MNIYISLPITGKCELNQRRKAKLLQNYFEVQGHYVVNPFELGDQLKKVYISFSGKEPTYEQYMQEDLCNLDDCSHIFLCDGWHDSKGCITEVERAMANGTVFLFESTYKFN